MAMTTELQPGACACEEGQDGTGKAEIQSQPQGHPREADDSVDGQSGHLAHGILGRPGDALGATVGHADLLEPHPAEHAPHEPILLSHALEGFDCSAVDQSKVAGIHRDIDVGQPP
jgi:hypothetical protein